MVSKFFRKMRKGRAVSSTIVSISKHKSGDRLRGKKINFNIELFCELLSVVGMFPGVPNHMLCSPGGRGAPCS